MKELFEILHIVSLQDLWLILKKAIHSQHDHQIHEEVRDDYPKIRINTIILTLILS